LWAWHTRPLPHPLCHTLIHTFHETAFHADVAFAVFRTAVQAFKREFTAKHAATLTTLQGQLDRVQAQADASIPLVEHEAHLRHAKDQYLTTLKRMRDELARDKERTWQVAEEAWARRKTELESAWPAG
jgi:hypothetical protein